MFVGICQTNDIHNCFRQVLVPQEEDFMGKMVEVDIISTGKHYLKGSVVREAGIERPDMVPPPLKQGAVSGMINGIIPAVSGVFFVLV